MSAPKTKKTIFRYREASDDNRSILSGLTGNTPRQRFIEYLREAEWTVFTPRPVEYATFAELVENDDELKHMLEQEDDAVLVAELLCRRYPHIFFSIDHVFQIYTDWKIKLTKKGRGHTNYEQSISSIPTELLNTVSDRDLEMFARRWFRKYIRRLNNEPKKTTQLLREQCRSEKNKKRRALAVHVLRLCENFLAMKYPEFVNELIPGKPFPSMHVRLWVQQILDRKNALIVGDVGTQKTSASVIGLEKFGCKAVIICCRSYAKEMWATEICRYYRASMDPLVIKNVDDIALLEQMSPSDLRKRRFIIIGYGNVQVGHVAKNESEESNETRSSRRHDEDTDLLDDTEEDRSYGARLIEALVRLKPDGVIIDEAHAIKSNGTRSQRIMRIAQYKTVKHRVILTATPFENKPNEVANLASLLSPKEYPSPQFFLAKCRNNPRIFFGVMTKLMCDYFAQTDVLDLPPTNLSIYGFFPTIELDSTREINRVLEMIRNDGDMEARLQVACMTRFLSAPATIQNKYVSLRQLACFTDPMANPKIAYLKQEVAKGIKTGKVVIASGIYASGITRDCDEVEDSLQISRLFQEWFPGQVLVLDGITPTDGPGSRKEIQHRWRNDRKAKILIASVPAASESLNFTLKKVRGSVEKVTIYYLSLPWKPTQYLQFNGRFGRPGSEVPLEAYILIVKGTSDEALLELNERKWRNFLIGVHGIPLQTDEEEALNRTTFAKIVTTPAQWLRDVFSNMLGMGEDRIESFLAKDFRDLPVGETIARYYLATEEYGTSGHISRVLVPALQQWQKSGIIPSWNDVLDVGCGPLILERSLNAPIHAIDINPMMIDVGRSHSIHRGKNATVGRATNLPASWTSRFSFIVTSLVLDLTSMKTSFGKGKEKEIERIRILRECHRVLKSDGLLWLTFQERCFDEDETFSRFVGEIETFGFEIVEPWANRIRALDHTRHPFAFWSVLVRKVREINTHPTCPLFDHERDMSRVVSLRPKKPPTKQTTQPEPELVKHERFAICQLNGTVIPIAMATSRVKKPEINVEPLLQAIMKQFRITEGSSFARELKKLLARHKPRSTTDLKEVWNQVRVVPNAPRIKWAELSRTAKSHLHT